MKLKNGDIIEHVDDCSSPKQMAGTAGQRKTVGTDIELYYAKRLLKGGRVKIIDKKTTTVTTVKEKPDADGGRNQKSDPKNAGSK